MRIPKLRGALVVTTDVVRVYRGLIAAKDLLRARSLQPFDRNFRAGFRYFRPLMMHQVNTMIDIGANRGNFLFPSIAYFRPNFALAVEPIPHLAQGLQQQLMHIKGTRGAVFQGVVSELIGQVQFHVTDYQSSSSLLYPILSATQAYGKSFNVVQTLTVKAITLDMLAQQYNLRFVDLIKIDVQGAERLIIEGGLATISRCRYLIIEMLFEECYEGQSDFFTLHSLLMQAGLRLGTLFNLQRSAKGTLLQCDALYVRKVAKSD